MDELQMILRDQDAVISRRQALDAGLSRAALEWKLERGEWVKVHPESDPIHVAVDAVRHLQERPGIRLHRVHGFEERVFWNLTPPRIQYEHAVWDVAEEAGELDAIAALADVCGSKRTWPARLRAVLASRARSRRRAWFEALLRDIEEGTCSVLEQRWLEVERRHGLPR